MWQVKAVFGVVVLGALVATDFVTGNLARPVDEQLSFGAYVAEWTSLASAAVPAAAKSADLAAALPAAPDGWKRNDTTPEDVAELLVPEAQAVVSGGGGEPGEDVRRLAAVGAARKGVQSAAYTYAYGRNRVVIELIRHPDAVMTDKAQIAAKMALQSWVMEEGAEKAGEIKGMQVWQARLVPGLGAQMLIASIGGQVQVRAVYGDRVKAGDVLEILAGLDIAALNRGVVEPDAAITAAVAAAAPVQDGEGFVGALTGMLFGKGEETKEERKSREAELIAAAKSGNAVKAGVLAAQEYGAIAEELGKAEMKAAPDSRAAARGRTTEITIGIGSCGDRGGGKFCSVAGKD